MRSLRGTAAATLGLLTTSTLSASASALSASEFVSLGNGVVGGLYRPASESNTSRLAIFVMHSGSDYTRFIACAELAARGFTVFCANNYVSKAGQTSDLSFELMMHDVGVGMSFLRNQTDIDRIVLFGHSGGGAMMAAYQNIAENGVSACNGDEKIYRCSDDLAGLQPVDGIMLVDAQYGTSTMTLLSLNPAIEDETTGLKINQSLNLFNPANGYADTGANDSANFTKAFQSGVAARWQRIMDYAEERRAAILAGEGAFIDDEPFYVPDAYFVGENNKLFAQDTKFLSHTVHAWPLLHNNGSVTTQIVHSVRVPANRQSFAESFQQGALKTTIDRFLSTFAIRIDGDFGYGADGFTGIDWSSSHLVPQASVRGIHVPLLTMGMTGHWEYLNAEKIYLSSASTDKSIAFVEGASHTIDVCTECESYPGEYGDTVKTCFDFMASWLAEEGRFP